MTDGIVFASAIVLSLVVTLILERRFIPYLMRIKMGQVILDIGPRWHKSKEGTPTMGGIFFIVPVGIISLAFGVYSGIESGDWSVLVTVVMMTLFGVIGFADDYTKFVKKQNKGLTAGQKLIFQFAVGAAYLAVMRVSGYIDTAVELPFVDGAVELGIFYYIINLVFIVFTVNSVNLTDGIDGLAGSVTLVIAVFFSALAFLHGSISLIAMLGAAVGGLIGFLCYNINPARIFMGDTGSLYLGGFVVGVAYIFNCPLLIFLAGLWYIIESVSVIIQVFSFKVFHRRVFKMTPIHHHFELLGWSEHRIVRSFSIFTALMCVIAYFAFRR